MKPFKGITGKCFGEYVCQHILGGNIMELDLSLLNVIAYEVMLYINVFGTRVGNWIVS